MRLRPTAAFALATATLTFACTGTQLDSSCAATAPAATSAATNAPNPALPLGESVEQMSTALWVVFHDSHGRHWFGSDGQGAYAVEGSSIVRYTTRDGLASDHVRQILEDDAGAVYFNTGGLVTRFDGERFTILQPIESADPHLAWRSEPGDLWFTGSDRDSGPYRYDGETLHRLTFPTIALGDEFNALYPGVPYSPYSVYSIHRDHHGALWFGTCALGVCRYDGRSFLWLLEDELTELQGGAMAGVRGILEDRDGALWFNSLQHRYLISTDPSAAPTYRKERGIVPVGRGDLPYAFFMSGLTDAAGHTWIATYSEGVWRHDGERFTHFPVTVDGQPVTLISIHADRDGVLWLGTHAHGAWRFNGTAFERFRP